MRSGERSAGRVSTQRSGMSAFDATKQEVDELRDELTRARDEIDTLTARINALFEGYVRQAPEQWWWFHKRFKPRRADRAGRRVDAAGVPVA